MKLIPKQIIRTLLFLCLFTTSMNIFSQTPFTTLVEEPRDLKKNIDGSYSAFTGDKSAQGFDTSSIVENDDNSSFFNDSSISMSVLSTGETRASISANVLHYKLNFLVPNNENTKKKYKYNIPLLLISKLSSNYDSINAPNAIDALDYEASPVTLRIMPSYKLPNGKTYKRNVYIGAYLDVRGLNMKDVDNNDTSIDIVYSGGIGFTFESEGEAGKYNRQYKKYKKGNWSFSSMLQYTTGKRETMTQIFDSNSKVAAAIQTYLVFKLQDESKFNIKIGMSNYFQKTLAGNSNSFSIALGI